MGGHLNPMNVAEGAMNVPGVATFEHTIQETNVWLKELVELLHLENRHDAYSALRAVLHALRDRMTPAMAVHLGAQLPMLVRGLYYEGWHMAGKPTKDRTVQEFADHVAQQLPPRYPMDPLTVTKGVFRLLWQRLDPGESAKIIDHLPLPLRALWP
ncbi:DUF2267 domain-containing protein [Reyranella sp.]|uniref:DUF2267 domain-containing protein n=1 Tax=Reyranella sp. TaxID=1929291 RepID=UPI003D0A0FEB